MEALSLVHASKRQAGLLLEAAAEATILQSLLGQLPAPSQAFRLTRPCDEALEADAFQAAQTPSEAVGPQPAHPQERAAEEALFALARGAGLLPTAQPPAHVEAEAEDAV